MSNVALITGASSGIGAELARYHAAQGGDLVLVARREEALNSIKRTLVKEFDVKVTVVVADLGISDSAHTIFQMTESLGLQIDILINNAGFGGHGAFMDRNLKEDLSIIDVNIKSLVSLTSLYLPGMLKRKSGHILHVGSTAGFVPGPYQSTYYASKAFVNSFSQALSEELLGTGVSSTVICPGPVRTGFIQSSHLEGLDIWKLAVSPKSVARKAYKAMMRGRPIVFNQKRFAFLIHWILPFVPQRVVLKVSKASMQKKNSDV